MSKVYEHIEYKRCKSSRVLFHLLKASVKSRSTSDTTDHKIDLRIYSPSLYQNVTLLAGFLFLIHKPISIASLKKKKSKTILNGVITSPKLVDSDQRYTGMRYLYFSLILKSIIYKCDSLTLLYS